MRDNWVSFHVLGAVAVLVNGADLRIAAPRQRALLAKLLLDANNTVAVPELIDALWGNSSATTSGIRASHSRKSAAARTRCDLVAGRA